MTSGDSDALRSPCLIPALMLSYSGLSQWIFLDDELSQTADVSEKTTLFSELFFRQIRSLLQHTMQPHKPSCWHNHREKAGWPAAGGTAREGKGLQRLHWAQQLCHWVPSHDCDDVTQLVLMPSDPTVTMFIASGWAHFNSKDCNIWGGGKSCTRQWAIFGWKLKDKFKFVWPLHYLASVLNLLTSTESHSSP